MKRNLKKEYRTVLNLAAAELEEKKSRFIATVKPVEQEEEALEFITGLKSKYWDATHNVYAYYIENETAAQRFSDDGEPSGTAGLPVLEAIKKAGVRDVAIVVTRYFGGTLLGAAGLVRAYGRAATMGIEAAGIIQRKLCEEIRIIIEYTLLGKLQNFIMSSGIPIKETIYGQDVEIIVFVPEDEAEKFLEDITELTNANHLAASEGKIYITLDNEGKLLKEPPSDLPADL